MKLDDYLTEKGIKPKAFAKRVGCSREQLWRIRTGKANPRLHILRNIVRESDGAVQETDFDMVSPK